MKPRLAKLVAQQNQLNLTSASSRSDNGLRWRPRPCTVLQLKFCELIVNDGKICVEFLTVLSCIKLMDEKNTGLMKHFLSASMA